MQINVLWLAITEPGDEKLKLSSKGNENTSGTERSGSGSVLEWSCVAALWHQTLFLCVQYHTQLSLTKHSCATVDGKTRVTEIP